MLIRWLLAAIHLLAFGFALASVLSRARALRRLDPSNSLHANAAGLRDVFRADNRVVLTYVPQAGAVTAEEAA